MDIELIQTHLDNFVDTWSGWTKVFSGLLNGVVSINTFVDAREAVADGEKEWSDYFLLSSGSEASESE